jgi:hypothetical protein
MAAYNKFHPFVQDLGRGVHNLNADALKIMLTNNAPAAANAVKADIVEIASGNGYNAGGATIAGRAYAQVAGVGKLTGDDVTWTASGSVGPFRYAVLYNDTPAAPADPLIGWWDRGSSITLASGDSFTVDLDAVNGILQAQ